MAQEDPRLMTGLFHDRTSAERAYGSVTERGYTKDDVSLLMSQDTRDRYFPKDDPARTELGTKAAEGAGVGAVAGGGVGALIGYGIPRERAEYYDEGVRRGGIVMGVTPRNPEDAEYIERQWVACGGEQIYCPTWRARDAA